MNASDVLPAQFNVASWFVDKNVAEGRGASPAFLHEDRTLTYADVQELVNRTGNALLELGVEMETRVLMLCLDAPEFIGTFWGAIKIGAVPVPVNTLMRTADYLYFLGDSRAKVAVISAPLLAEAAPALVDAKRLKHVLVAGGNHGQFVSYEDRIAKASATLEAAPTSRDDAAFWQYSSGSTGFPKGAVHLHHDMVVCCETYGKQVLGIRPTDRVYSAAKLFFAYGLGNACFFPMGVGAQSVLYPHRPTPESVFELIARYRPTLFFGVPTLYAGMLAVKEAEVRFDTSSLRLCVSAGEALPDEIYRRWRVRHPAVLEAAVVGQEDSDRLVKPKAFVVLKEPWRASDELANELKAFVKDKIAPYKYPRWIEFAGELPKTATGKIQRFKLRG